MNISLLLLSFILNLLNLSQSTSISMLENIKLDSSLIICHSSLEYTNFDEIRNSNFNLRYKKTNPDKSTFAIAKKSNYTCGFVVEIPAYPITIQFFNFKKITYEYVAMQSPIKKTDCNNEKNIICQKTLCDYTGKQFYFCCDSNFCNEKNNLKIIKANRYPDRTMSNSSYDQYAYDECDPRGGHYEETLPCIIFEYIPTNNVKATAESSHTPSLTIDTTNRVKTESSHTPPLTIDTTNRVKTESSHTPPLTIATTNRVKTESSYTPPLTIDTTNRVATNATNNTYDSYISESENKKNSLIVIAYILIPVATVSLLVVVNIIVYKKNNKKRANVKQQTSNYDTISLS